MIYKECFHKFSDKEWITICLERGRCVEDKKEGY